MQIDNPIRVVRELKGAPISILLVLGFAAQRVTQEWLERATGYTDKPVSQALAYLAEIGLVDHTRAGWQLTGEGRQLPLGLALEENITTESQRSEEKSEEGGEDGEEKSDTNGISRNNSDSIAAAALSIKYLSSFKDLSSCCSEVGRKNSDLPPNPLPEGKGDDEWDRDMVRAILVAEGIGPPKLDALVGRGLDPVWVYAHVLKWRSDEKSKGILIIRLECGDKIRYDKYRTEDRMAEAFPEFYNQEGGDENE